MPPKSSKNIVEWHQCVRCASIVHVKEMTKHRSECDEGKRLTHGHVVNNVLKAPACLIPADKVSLPSHLRNNIVLVHPSLMQLCGFTIGGHCLLSQTTVHVCWPCAAVGASSVGLSETDLAKVGPAGMVDVEVFHPSDVRLAGEVVLQSRECNSVIKDEKIGHHLQRYIEGKYLCCGAEVDMQYFGQKFVFTVKTITEQRFNIQTFQVNSRPNQRQQCSNDSLSSGLADLSLNTSGLDTSLSSPVSSNKSGMFYSTPQSKKADSSLIEASASDISLNTSCSTPSRNRAEIDRVNFQTPVINSRNSKRLGQTNESRFYKVTPTTKVQICEENEEISTEGVAMETTMSYADVGGLDKQISMLKEMINTPLRSPELFQSYGLTAPRGVLIFGPSGCGKSLLVKAVTMETNINTIHVAGPEIWSKFYGETESKLRNLFHSAVERAPSLLVLEDVDSLCPRRDTTNSEVEKRVVASLLTLMDGITETSKGRFVLVLGTSSKLDLIDPALRRPGRFDREIEIGVPSALDRREILRCLMRKVHHSLNDDDIRQVADVAHGYVGADMAALCKEASLHCMQTRQDCQDGDSLDVCISLADMKYAMDLIQPSAMREVQLEVPKVLWSDIGGQDKIKLKLKQAVEWPLKHPEAFTRMGISPPRGILMYGPPGCSKTMIAKALATESGLNFIAVKGPELFSKWVGESERAVREVFRKARSAAPSIIFFDEIDALAIERGSSSGSSNVADRVLAQLLTEIDGVESLKDVTIVAATNRPDMIDKALMRPGRFDRVLYVPLPDVDTRQQIFTIHLRKMPVADAVTPEWLAEQTDGYSGAEIASVCHEAAMYALQEDITSQSVEQRHFVTALKTVTPRINQSLVDFYERYQQASGLHSV